MGAGRRKQRRRLHGSIARLAGRSEILRVGGLGLDILDHHPLASGKGDAAGRAVLDIHFREMVEKACWKPR